jgi:hypothetical protein
MTMEGGGSNTNTPNLAPTETVTPTVSPALSKSGSYTLKTGDEKAIDVDTQKQFAYATLSTPPLGTDITLGNYGRVESTDQRT